MRRNNLSHGTGASALARLRADSEANSARVSGGVAGTSRKYHDHANTHARLNNASATNEPRHEISSTSEAIRGGVRALPSRAKEWVMPWAKPQFRSGVHTAMARVAVGKAAPSPTPRTSRAKNRLMRPPTAPV